jgi:hypothetical protein
MTPEEIASKAVGDARNLLGWASLTELTTRIATVIRAAVKEAVTAEREEILAILDDESIIGAKAAHDSVTTFMLKSIKAAIRMGWKRP